MTTLNTPTDLTAVNLFAGIEGFGLALHRAGIRTVAAVEIEPMARGVIADHFPDTTLFNDVRERYRRLGNSIAVPVFQWVAERLVEVDRRLTTDIKTSTEGTRP